MNQREKLIELLDIAFLDSDDNYGIPDREQVADYLLANGVVVLPCQVGDTVYQVGRDFCDERSHDKCDAYCDGWDDMCPKNNGEWEVQTRVFTVRLLDLVGDGIFLTREEAETALEKRKGGDE